MNHNEYETYANTVACSDGRAVLLLPDALEEIGRNGFLKIEGEVLEGRKTPCLNKCFIQLHTNVKEKQKHS